MSTGSRRFVRRGLAALALSGALAITGSQLASAQSDPGTGAPPPPATGGPGPQAAPPGGPDAERQWRDFREFREWQEFQRFERWQHWQHAWHRNSWGAVMALDHPLLRAFRRLDLSAAQWQQVHAALRTAHQVQPALQQPDQRQALLDPSDPGHAQALQEVRNRALARIEQAAQLQQRLYQILTPEQQQRFKQMLAQAQSAPRWHSFGRGPAPFRRGGSGEPGSGAQQAPVKGPPSAGG